MKSAKEILELQTRFENGEVLESELSDEDIEQLYDLYEKQCKDLENDTHRTLKKLPKIFFEIIANIVARHTKIRASKISLSTPMCYEPKLSSCVKKKIIDDVEKSFEISIRAQEKEEVYTVEDLLDIVIREKGLLDLR